MNKIYLQNISALISSWLIWLIFGKQFIKKIATNFLNGQREFLDQHEKKSRTPTMGGIFIIFSTIITIIFNIIWTKKYDHYSLMFIIFGTLYGFIGLIDDYHKLRKKRGITSFEKAFLQIFFGIICSVIFIKLTGENSINLNFLNIAPIKNNFLFVFWFVLIFTATTNAVNITDGLDGLAVSTILPALGFFGYICSINSNSVHSNLTICCYSLIGSCLGFLWYNSYPAQIFMGDVGSLYLGAVLAYLAIACKQELMLVLVGGIFVLETLSTIIQVLYYKKTKKRFFKMAPYHHHLELCGINENKITARLTTLSIILSLIALAILDWTFVTDME